MTKDVKIIPEEIDLFHIDILKSEIKEGTKPSDPSYELEVAHTTGHNLKDERIKLKLIIKLSDNSKGDNRANYEIDFHFKINKLQNFYTIKEDQSPLLSGNLIATLLGISFSTARGILYERLANTNFKGVILPIVSPIKMLETKIKS